MPVSLRCHNRLAGQVVTALGVVGHRGTRKSKTSRRDQTWSVSPAAIAGGWGRHCVAEPVPFRWLGKPAPAGGGSHGAARKL